jgi:hypothetical protein
VTAHPVRLESGALHALAALVLAAGLALASACADGSGPAAPSGPEPDAGDGPGRGTVVFAPDEVLLRLGPGTDVQDLTARYEAYVAGELLDGRTFLLRTVGSRTVLDLLPEMTRERGVEIAEPNYWVSHPESQGTSSMTFADPALGEADAIDQQALARIRARAARGFGTGDGVVVAILDTGVETSHPVLAGRVAAGGLDLVDGDADPADAADGVDSDRDGLVDEAAGHGTFVAGLVLAVAPRAAVLPVRILDSDGIGTAFAVARGLEAAERRGARVVNMSFGMSIRSVVVEEVSARLAAAGVVLVASAGNAGSERPPQYPAALPQVLGVAASDALDRRAPFSNHGGWVDLAAPGVGLVSAFPRGGFATWSGTSFAAALASGAAAVLVSGASEASASQVLDALAVGGAALEPPVSGTVGAGPRARLDVLESTRHLRPAKRRLREDSALGRGIFPASKPSL